jgi:hypothetical protein
MTLKIQHKRSAVKAKAPQPTDLEYGEIAVNYEASDPCIYIKDSANAIRRIGHQPGALVLQGSVAPTSVAPASPDKGDVYVMTTAGVMAASWTGMAGKTVVQNENIVWDGTEWETLGATSNAAATETAAGIVELATAAETTTGTDATRAVHPAGLKVELDKKAPKTITSDTAPANPADGDLWYDSVGGELYVFYDSDDAGAVAGTWVQANPQPTPKQATASVAGVVQLADAAAITAGTAGLVVDAAQLKAKTNVTYGASYVIFTDPASGKRIMHCWGTGSGTTADGTITFTLPFAYADTSYCVLATMGGGLGAALTSNYDITSPSTFNLNRMYHLITGNTFAVGAVQDVKWSTVGYLA